MPETDELKIFLTNDPSRTVSVSVSELERLVNATRYYAEHGITCMQPTIHERTCHVDTPIIDWETGETDFACSECGDSEDPADWPRFRFCPHCGARVVSGHE